MSDTKVAPIPHDRPAWMDAKVAPIPHDRPPSRDATADAAQGAAESTAGDQNTACTTDCPTTVTIVITVERMYDYHQRGTPGKLKAVLEGGEARTITGFTTERRIGRYAINKGEKNYPIPAGTYNAHVRRSGKNGNIPRPYKETAVELLQVPNFSDILIHTGNYPRHSEGCIILASSNAEGDENVESSVPKVTELMEWIAEIKARYGPANVAMKVIVKDPPAGAQPPALPE